jgi:mitogen-activated protein kinase 15
MSTDLYHAIYESALEEVHRKYILYQLLLGLHYLHSARLVHRDLKPSNLLLSPQCHLKICDFGLVRHLGSHHEDVAVMTEGVATRWYRAPELLLGSQTYNEKVDLWSVGCILAEMLIKNPLFNCNSTLSHI